MKQTILLFLFISGLVFSQNTQYITSKDFIKNPNDKNQMKCDKMIKAENGENEFVNTKLFIGKSLTNKKDSKYFNKMIYLLMLNAKYTLKNPSTFKPIDITIFEEDNGHWLASINYNGMNNIGGKRDATFALTFDDELKYTERYRSTEL